MNYIIRGAEEKDLANILDLAKQFSLLNLPSDKTILRNKIEKSQRSFAGELSKEESAFLFVLEDLETGRVAGSSQVIAKKGTPAEPNYSFQVLKKERFSKDLGVGFIHQILRLKVNEDGPSEIGGLVVGKSYRRRPEKLGKLISLCRFNFIGMKRDFFQKTILSDMAPPLTEDGRSEFWEALGRRFTGMPYKEADQLSQRNKEFIRCLFPEEDIYLCLLDSKARLVMGRVSNETQPALHLLETIGMKYNNEVDPFDGGPHLEALMDDISLIKGSRWYNVVRKEATFNNRAIISTYDGQNYRAMGSSYEIKGENLLLPDLIWNNLKLNEGDKVYFTPIEGI